MTSLIILGGKVIGTIFIVLAIILFNSSAVLLSMVTINSLSMYS